MWVGISVAVCVGVSVGKAVGGTRVALGAGVAVTMMVLISGVGVRKSLAALPTQRTTSPMR